ncbi:MAG: helix-turn-helix transcriptional regulator [Bacteroidetes bacterium]|nr:helix-turn-helix transcriptional regulator [Bacteroidota bacterium]
MNTQNSLMPLLTKIGNKLYSLRHERKDKLVNVAKGVGLTHPVISQIERGLYLCLSSNCFVSWQTITMCRLSYCCLVKLLVTICKY